MARNGNQHRNGVDRNTSNHKKKVADFTVPDVEGQRKMSELKAAPQEQLSCANQPISPTNSVRESHYRGDENKINQNFGKFQNKKGQGTDEMRDQEESISSKNNSSDSKRTLIETPGMEDKNGTLPGSQNGQEHTKSGLGFLLHGLHPKKTVDRVKCLGNVMVRNLSTLALSMVEVFGEWAERQRPSFVTLTTSMYNAHDYAKLKIEQAYPVVLRWLAHFGNIVLILSMVWLDCTLRGIDSFLRLGTTTFFTVIWCSILSVISMIGMIKFLIVLVIAALVGVFIGLMLGLLVVALSGFAFLWSYGSFWTTALVMIIGGLVFMFSHERLPLLIMAGYSGYCAWTYVGWLGLLLALNLSFISSDVLMYFVKINVNQHRRYNIPSEHPEGMEGRASFAEGESPPASFSEVDPGLAADRSPGMPSTSGADIELTSEDEITRLMNCKDHYSVWGIPRYENVNVSLLRREYRKKAMLVHPDKNMGNEKAAEAFKKLQNAYEVLLDSSKRKAYDDDLRREDILNYFRRFQSTAQKNGEHGSFASGFTHSEADVEDPFGDSRHIACKKCGDFHLWVLTKKSKSRARWCQDCKDFHQAKDGDGWVEQSSQPFLFGLLQKVNSPSAYVCADSKIYKVTEWYICQGMRCPANTHKPSFHVNTSVPSNKQNTSKGSSSGQRSGRMPASNVEETMTEEEFLEWLQNAMQAGRFENFSASKSSESPHARDGNGPKSSAAGSSSSSKKKKRGKKQW